MKFRKKPLVIEAEQHRLDHWVKVVSEDKTSSTKMSMETLEGKHEVTWGDWIVTGIKGEKYPVKPDIFEETYEPVRLEENPNEIQF